MKVLQSNSIKKLIVASNGIVATFDPQRSILYNTLEEELTIRISLSSWVGNDTVIFKGKDVAFA